VSASAHGAWQDWSAALDRILSDVASIADEACPSCGAKNLHIAFTGNPETRLGYASLWCDTSMDGIFTSRLHIPAGVAVIPVGLPAEERLQLVPNFHVVPPTPVDGDDTETVTF
jgi:hypothetical protein